MVAFFVAPRLDLVTMLFIDCTIINAKLCLNSLVVEHLLRKQKVVSSILI